MNTHADKTQENKSQSVSSHHSQIQSGGEPAFQFVDNRSEAIAQRKLQGMTNNSPQAKRATQLQAKVNNLPQHAGLIIQRINIPGENPPSGVKAPKKKQGQSAEYKAWKNEKKNWPKFQKSVQDYNEEFPSFTVKAATLWQQASNPNKAFQLLTGKREKAVAQKRADEELAKKVEAGKTTEIALEPKKGKDEEVPAGNVREERRGGMPGLAALMRVSDKWNIGNRISSQGSKTKDGNPLITYSLYRKIDEGTFQNVECHIHVHTGAGSWTLGTISANLRAGSGNMNLGGDQAIDPVTSAEFSLISGQLLGTAKAEFLAAGIAEGNWIGTYEA